MPPPASPNVFPFSARNARVSIGGAFFPASKWCVTYKVEEIDVTSAEDTAALADILQSPTLTVFSNVIPGTQEAQVDVEMFWDPSNDPFGGAIYLVPGTSLADVRLLLDRTGKNVSSGVLWRFPLLLVTSATVDAEVRGVVKLNFTARNQGPFFCPSITNPTQTDPPGGPVPPPPANPPPPGGPPGPVPEPS